MSWRPRFAISSDRASWTRFAPHSLAGSKQSVRVSRRQRGSFRLSASWPPIGSRQPMSRRHPRRWRVGLGFPEDADPVGSRRPAAAPIAVLTMFRGLHPARRASIYSEQRAASVVEPPARQVAPHPSVRRTPDNESKHPQPFAPPVPTRPQTKPPGGFSSSAETSSPTHKREPARRPRCGAPSRTGAGEGDFRPERASRGA